MTREAIASIGPYSGLRVYEKGVTDRPILYLDPTARAAWIGLARDALDNDAIDLVSDGKTYRLPAGVPLARQILTALQDRG